MKTHSQIIADADPREIAEKRGVSIHTVRSWCQRDSIPADHWQGLVNMGLTTLEELAEAAARRSRSAPESEAA